MRVTRGQSIEESDRAMTDLISGDYATLLADIKERTRSARYAALKAVNKELIGRYWDIGCLIVER